MSATPLHAASQRLHVLQILGNAITGGMETSVERLLERLPSERFKITVLCPFESELTDRLRLLGADVVMATITDDPSWLAIQMTCALVKAQGVDVIHAHLPNAHVLAGIVGRLTGKPVLATIHGRQLTATDLEVHRAASTHLVLVCRHSHLHAVGIGANPKLLHLIPNGVDAEVFTPADTTSGTLRQTCAVAHKAPVVGFVGRLSWEKGPDVFLRAALAIQAVRPETHFIVVGEGPMRAQLLAFTRSFALESCVHLVGGQTAMRDVFAQFDVMVSSSRSEAMPLAVMEAMACGIPVVACKVGGISDLVQHGVSGWLANDGDYEGIAAGVLEYLGNDPARFAAARAARKRAVERFAIESTVAATAELLERLVQSPTDVHRLAPVSAPSYSTVAKE